MVLDECKIEALRCPTLKAKGRVGTAFGPAARRRWVDKFLYTQTPPLTRSVGLLGGKHAVLGLLHMLNLVKPSSYFNNERRLSAYDSH
jgi:hypothetical protein